MKKSLIPLVISILLVIILQAGMWVFSRLPMFDYVDDPSMELKGGSRVQENLRHIEEWGLDTHIACASDQSFAAPASMELVNMWDVKLNIRRGDRISTDFVSYSMGGFDGTRYLKIISDGKEYFGHLGSGQVLKLYMAYIEELGLEEQFQQETGEKFSRSAARRELKEIDRQLFQLGILEAQEWPVNLVKIKNIVLIICIFLPIAGLAASALVNYAGEAAEYGEYLTEWNEESAQRWDSVSGELPQFESLRASGMRDEYRWRKRSFWESLKELFKPVGK